VILAIDQGTTGTTCLVFDELAEPIGRAYREFAQHFPQPGWVEHDALEIWEVTQAVAGEALADAGLEEGELEAVGMTNQRETVCVWDPASGLPLHNAIVWQDRRTAARCEELRAAGHEPLVRERTGLVLDPYFSATKIQWLLENVEGLRERALAGRAVFGTVDSWLSFKLTGEHVTDVSNASRTMLFDIAAGRWDPELMDLLDVPERALPRVLESAGVLGETRPQALHGHAVPLAGVAGDQQAALFGQACVEEGMGKNTYGTGSFVLFNTGFTAPEPPAGLLATIAWGIGGSTAYALEGSIFVTGAAVQWLRDGLGIIERADQTEALTAMEQTSGKPLSELRVDGGACANSWLMQFQADMLGVPVVLPEITETTALGAAYLAGVGTGRWTVGDLRDGWRERRRYEPNMSEDERATLLAGWNQALAKARTDA
jgi:glycerol kinase